MCIGGNRVTRSKQDNQQHLGAAIKRIRQELGVSASELARRAELSRSYISYLESGRFNDVGLDKFARIATALEVSADQLLAAAGYLPSSRDTIDIKSALRRQLGLTGKTLEQAMEFLRFLTDQSKQRMARAR
jgi:transcriptional regulator with XRE-family HTH domain